MRIQNRLEIVLQSVLVQSPNTQLMSRHICDSKALSSHKCSTCIAIQFTMVTFGATTNSFEDCIHVGELNTGMCANR